MVYKIYVQDVPDQMVYKVLHVQDIPDQMAYKVLHVQDIPDQNQLIMAVTHCQKPS